MTWRHWSASGGGKQRDDAPPSEAHSRGTGIVQTPTCRSSSSPPMGTPWPTLTCRRLPPLPISSRNSVMARSRSGILTFEAPRRCSEGNPDIERKHHKGRKVADCRDFPSESGCTLAISGEEDEVVTAATHHAVAVHGHEDTEEVRTWLRQNLKDEVPA